MVIKTILHKYNLLKHSFWKCFNERFFKLKGAVLGKNIRVYNKIYLQIYDGKLTIGNNFTLTSGNCINPLCRNIRACIHITHSGVVKIGNNVGMSSPCIWVRNSLTIGDNVNVGGNCIIMDNDAHEIDYKARRGEIKGEVKSAPIVIEDDVWLGANVMVLKGVKIGARSIIGAGSVVTRNIPSDCIAVGNPARVIKNLK